MPIEFGKIQVFEHADRRRVIRDATLPEGMSLPFVFRQFKTIALSDEAIKEQLVVGNHYHTSESGRWEFYVVFGEEGVPLVKFRFRKAGDEEIQEKEMEAGETCIIPPMYSHAFLGLKPGVQLFGISNCTYDSQHDVSDKLF